MSHKFFVITSRDTLQLKTKGINPK